MNDEEIICTVCGYDHNTKTINNAFKSKIEAVSSKSRRGKAQGIDSRVKKFAYAGLIITGASLFYKHNFNVANVVSDLSRPFAKLKKFQPAGDKSKNKKGQKAGKLELIEIKSFEGNKKSLNKKDLKIEGIFFDPSGKSFIAIGGKIISEGQGMDNIIVKKINKDSAELIVESEIKILKLSESLSLRRK